MTEETHLWVTFESGEFEHSLFCWCWDGAADRPFAAADLDQKAVYVWTRGPATKDTERRP